MVRRIRAAEVMMGVKRKMPTAAEKMNQKGMKRSLTALEDIPAGAIVKAHMIGFKRPMGGLPPNMLHAVIGRKAKRAIPKDRQLTSRDV